MLKSIALCAVIVLSSPVTHSQQQTSSSADARLRALSTEEWNWRQKELAGLEQRMTEFIATEGKLYR